MKIKIKRNEHIERWHICSKCGSELIYTKDDVFGDSSRGYVKLMIKCPNCGQKDEIHFI